MMMMMMIDACIKIDACINDVIQIVTYNFNKFWIFLSISNWIARQYIYFCLGFALPIVLLKNGPLFVLMRDFHITD